MTLILTTAISWLLAAVFAQALWHKTRNYLEFTGILKQYRLLPDWSLSVAAPLLVLIEAVISAGLLFTATRKEAQGLACLVLLAYAAAMSVNLIRGRREIDCGCGGPPTPLNEWLVVRNLVLAGAGTWLASVSAKGLDAASTLIALGTALLLIVLYVTANQLIANLPYTRRVA
ncbi:MAG: methylamine utilization protein MauE [Proteobacteria bacterium]|nr:methylamine utilization protein MauE [Pseudomonadota bacterium]